MSYEKRNESQGVQEGFKQAQIPPVVWGAALVLGMIAFLIDRYPQLIWALIVGVIVGVGVWHYMETQRKEREAIARAAGFANICGPCVICSAHPLETVQELMERVDVFREQLKISGNPYADKISVIAHPYQPMIYGPGQLTMAWNIYLRQVGEAQHLENERWAAGPCPKELRGVFLSQVMRQITEPEMIAN